ncbi:hypothetical protein OROMI_003085 [Orobanche minor]
MLPFIKSSLPFIAVAVGGGLGAIYIKYRTLAGEIFPPVITRCIQSQTNDLFGSISVLHMRANCITTRWVSVLEKEPGSIHCKRFELERIVVDEPNFNAYYVSRWKIIISKTFLQEWIKDEVVMIIAHEIRLLI